MLTEALQVGDLDQFRLLLDKARAEKGQPALDDRQFTALCHAVRGREMEIFVLKDESGSLHGFCAAALEFSLDACRYLPKDRGCYFEEGFRDGEPERLVRAFMADSLKIREIPLPDSL